MMLLATFMLGAFIIHSVFTEDIDDDDGPGWWYVDTSTKPNSITDKKDFTLYTE